MYAKGDKIVYPMYGAGIIEELHEKNVDNLKNVYYVVRMPIGNLTIMVSALKANDLGLRQIHDIEVIFTAIKSVLAIPVEMPGNWSIRHKENMDKIKTGKVCEIALVYRNLLFREREKGLSSAEKKMLINAKHIILSEIILSKNVEKEEAEQILSDLLSIV